MRQNEMGEIKYIPKCLAESLRKMLLLLFVSSQSFFYPKFLFYKINKVYIPA